jgi:phage-related protein
MAVYKSGLEVDATSIQSGEFDIVFDCKPQRWLTSGETAVSVADGGTLDNPTLFESEPLLAVEGYGNINFNGYDIDIENVVLGDIILNNGGSFTPGGNSKTMFFNSETVNNGDALSSGVSIITARITTTNNNSFYWDLTNFSATDSNASFTTGTASMSKTQSGKNYFIEIPITIQPLSFVVGTNSTISNTTTYTINGKRMGASTTFTITGTITTYVEYLSASYGVKFDQTMTATSSNANVAIKTAVGGFKMTIGQIEANSTVSALGNPTYIDCDLGECYMFGNNDEIVLLNQYIDLGSDLPRLVSGTNTINYDNTITDFKVTPCRWKV